MVEKRLIATLPNPKDDLKRHRQENALPLRTYDVNIVIVVECVTSKRRTRRVWCGVPGLAYLLAP